VDPSQWWPRLGLAGVDQQRPADHACAHHKARVAFPLLAAQLDQVVDVFVQRVGIVGALEPSA
jgi:hypothetical protein